MNYLRKMKKADLLQLQGTVIQRHPTWGAVQLEINRRQNNKRDIIIALLVGVFIALSTLYFFTFLTVPFTFKG